MKKFFFVASLLFVFVIGINIASADIPQLISLQGKLEDKVTGPVTGDVAMSFEIYDDVAAGNLLWGPENHATVGVSNGLFSTTLGSVETLNLPFDKDYWLKITVNGEPMADRFQITSSGYAYQAAMAEDVIGIDATKIISGILDLARIPTITSGKIADSAITAAKIAAGAVTNAKIIGPISASKIEDVWVNTAGDTMTGNLDMNFNTIRRTGALELWKDWYGNVMRLDIDVVPTDIPRGLFCTRDYTNDNWITRIAISSYLDSGLGTIWFYENLNMGGKDITNIGTLSKASGSFLIDHPLDPRNKILRHSFVESPEMVLIYKGRAKLKNGGVAIELPDYFDALNQDESIEYSLTPLNSLCRLGIKEEVKGNKFIVMGDSDCEFSWIIYSVRDDAFAKAYPIIVEEEKSELEKGKCIYEEACEGLKLDKETV